MIERSDYSEGDGIQHDSTTLYLYGPELGVLWTGSANRMTYSIDGNVLTIKSRTYISGDDQNEEIEETTLELIGRNGELVTNE